MSVLEELRRERVEQETMEPRERAMASIERRTLDRVPIDFWATRDVRDRLVRELGASSEGDLLDAFGVDLHVIRGPSLVGIEMETMPDGSIRDLWGVVRRPISFGVGKATGTYREVSHSPLAGAESAKEIDEYGGWPDPEWWDYSSVADDCRRHEGHCVVFAGDRLDRTAQLKTAIYLRGMKRIFRDLRENPAIAESIFRHIVEYFLEYNRRVFEAADGMIDIFMMGDDFGTQHGLMMPIDMWRHFFEEGFRSFIRLAHHYGIRVMHHTCGSIRPLVPIFIEDGLDILQSLQPKALGMELGGLKHDFGSRLCLHGSIDIQHTMPRGTEDEIDQEVSDRMEKGKPGGGFIICTAHNLQVDVPTRNILAMIRAYHRYGWYH